MDKRIAMLILCLQFSSAAFSNADNQQTEINPFPIEVLTEDFYPYNYKENGELKGLSVATLAQIVQSAGYYFDESTIRLVAWSRGFLIAQTTPNTMLFSTARTQERQNLFKWVGPIDDVSNVIIGLKNRGISIKSVEDIKRYKLGVLSTMPKEVFKGTGLSFALVNIVDKHEQNVKKLINGRIDLMSVDGEVNEATMRKMGLNPEEIEVFYELNKVTLYYAFHKDTDDKIIEALNRELSLFKAVDSKTGKSPFDRVVEKYLGEQQ